MTIRFTLNNQRVEANAADADMPLLYFLREAPRNLNGPSFGCGLGQCGACTVLADNEAIRSCITPLSAIAGKTIVTLESLGGGALHPLQKAFIEEGAVQCGYCANGMIMQSAAFLAKNKRPTEEQIRTELAQNLCRCGTHDRIIKAVKRAASSIAG